MVLSIGSHTELSIIALISNLPLIIAVIHYNHLNAIRGLIRLVFICQDISSEHINLPSLFIC
jgi:hypothetical protein